MPNLLAVLMGKTICVVEYRITGGTRSFDLELDFGIFLCFCCQHKSIELVSGGHRVGRFVVNQVPIHLIFFILNVVITNIINIVLT